MAVTEITVPDIGDFKDVPIIEVLVKAGDRVDAETPLITLESDKATMDVPSPVAGVVQQVIVNTGDTVSEGSTIVLLETNSDGGSLADEVAQVAATLDGVPETPGTQDTGRQIAPIATSSQEKVAPAHPSDESAVIEITVPDIGDFKDVPVIDVLVKAGDTIETEAPLVTLESDKATMDVPSPAAGTVLEVLVQQGDTVSEGSLIVRLSGITDGPGQAASTTQAESASTTAPAVAAPAPATATTQTGFTAPKPPASLPPPVERAGVALPHASPSIRRFARELGVDLTQVRGSGPKGRILREDVQAWVKQRVAQPAAPGGGPMLPEMPDIDFSKFGDIEVKPLNRIKRLTAANLHRSWLHVPHVTHHDEADITELEEFRNQMKQDAAAEGIKLTPLAFVLKGCVAALRRYPTFNASLEKGGENLIIKNYYHIGVAVDTPDGLVVPMVRDADKKGVMTIAKELGEVSERARNKKLSPQDMQGASFTISSLGGIGGTAFTPIINAPEVAILGVTRAQTKPVYQGDTFVPRLMLPLSLSYDHRVIDGAEAARFVSYLTQVLSDVRRLLL